MNAHPTPVPDGTEDLRGRFEEAAPVILVDPEPVVRRARRRRAVVRAASGLGVVVAVLAVVLLVRPDGAATNPAVTGPPPPEPERSVAIEVLPGVVEPGAVVTAVLVASEPNSLTFGVAAEVDRWDGSEWRRAGAAGLCLVEWQCVGTVTDQLDGVNDIGLSATPGTPGEPTLLSTEGLGDGWYRLVQRAALGAGVATGVFEVRTGALAAPPLPPQDEVRLTVDPVMLPPEGGVARVTTQVPAGPDGTLTAEDIEEVDGALDPSALVQRWDGEEWRDVVDVPVLAREADLGVEWGSPVVLPALEEGSYRLVRTWPGEAAPWGVFTVAMGAPPLEQPAPSTEPSAEPDASAADGDTAPGEDVYAPDHPLCAEQAGRCLLEAWWRDVVAAAGIERGGGDHDFGLLLTDSVRVADQRTLMLTLFPAEAAPESTTGLTVETTTQVGDAEVEAGRWDDGTDGRRLTCGGFVLQTWSTDLAADEIDHVVGALADAMADCPADVAGLAARYPEYPAVP
jgi:hypothetical protein